MWIARNGIESQLYEHRAESISIPTHLLVDIFGGYESIWTAGGHLTQSDEIFLFADKKKRI
jgi:hypothetical protein